MKPLGFTCLMAILSLMSTDEGAAQLARYFVGASGGVSIGDLGGAGFATSVRVGGTAGLFGGVRPTRNMVLNLGTNWVQKGGGETRLDYVEVPLTVGGVALIEDGLYRGRFYTGLSLGIKVGCSSNLRLPCGEAAATEWAWPIGLLVGRWGSGSHFLALDVRYTHGLSDAFESVPVNTRSWQFRLLTGWRIRGKR
ncbi:MAG: hypothetical protein JSW71_04430 [Gemmatimonadota bacterium]|nr:MAG: hypothetical protein JSW71_04430 [Gemmatimonadota bacterium]